jgi:hypothetical protein
MDGNTCDRHPSARAAAKVILANLGTLYWCNHCVRGFENTYTGPFHVQYETVEVSA